MSADHETLWITWTHLAQSLNLHTRRAEAVFANFTQRYSTSDRHYHNLDHIAFVLTIVHILAQPTPSPLDFAALLHDVIYDSRASNNEERSATYAGEILRKLDVPPEIITETQRLILLTKGHETTDGDLSGKVLLDADLAILGADQATYDAYARAIRQEYAWVAETEYCQGRRAVLQRFLSRPQLYHVPAMHDHLETAARKNLRREIASLGGD